MRTAITQRERLADLSTTVGAGVLGTGLGVVLAERAAGLGPATIAAGLALHAWGMLDRRALEAAARLRRPAWSAALYWICWLALGALVAYAVVRTISAR